MTKKRTWLEARQRCQGLGADLVALTTKKKNDYIVDVALKVKTTLGQLFKIGKVRYVRNT